MRYIVQSPIFFVFTFLCLFNLTLSFTKQLYDRTSLTSMTQPEALILETESTPGMEKPSILIVVAGGTIIMSDDGSGLRTNKTLLKDVLANTYFFQQPDVPKYDIIYMDPLIDSSQAVPSDWVCVARHIVQNYENYDGFVVVHGTDSLSYTSSALSFLLMDIRKPVVVTGSQIPLSKSYNDGFSNLIGSMLVAGYSNIPEVTVFFHGNLFRGNRVQKISAWDQDAFSSGSFPSLGKWGVKLTMRRSLILPTPFTEFKPSLSIADKGIIQVRLFPGIDAEFLKRCIVPGETKGVILNCYGAGNGADSDDFYELISSLRDQIVFVDVTQTHQGYVEFDYAASHKLRDSGVLPGADMTVEAAFAKLSWLFGQEKLAGDINLVKQAMATPLVGEMSLPNDYWGSNE